jgi:phosphoribosylglycinamide formyltransferase-1
LREPILGGTLAVKRFAIFASGVGSNAKNLILFSRENPDKFSIKVLITDKKNASVIYEASKLGVPVEIIPFGLNKDTHEEEILSVIKKYDVDWIALAGYMRILSPNFLSHFFDKNLRRNRVINIHPSLLPNFPGKDAYGDAYAAKVPVSGVTVHFVDSGVDSGPIILQRSFERLPGDTIDDFITRGKKVEHELYREAINLVAEDQI